MGAKSGKPGQRKKPAERRSVGRNRLALIVFGALFAVLFAIFAVAQGIGQPSVPSGDVALIKSAPEGLGHVSEAELKRTIEQAAAAGGLKKPPKPGSKKYEELQATAMAELIEGTWLRGEAESLGISVTEKQVEDELAQIKKTSFPKPAAYKEFLETSHFTQKDVNDRVELQVITKEIQSHVSNETKPPSKSEIASYYDEEKATKYTVKPSRDVRVIVNKKKAVVEKALKALEKDNSPASWKKVAAKYSSDPTTKTNGGLQTKITEELLVEPLKKDLFGGATGELIGPVPYQGNFFIFEVVKLHPEKVKSLEEVESEISKQLTEEAQEEAIEEFVAGYQSKWSARTFCASGFLVKQCSNFEPSAHPSTAPAACYEAHPKTPATECPAPVEQTKPALPGTISPHQRGGEPFVQRPQPEAKSGAVKETKLGAEGAEAEAGSETGE